MKWSTFWKRSSLSSWKFYKSSSGRPDISPSSGPKWTKAHRNIEARRSQASLKADIVEKCRLVNDKKAALNAKIDTFASSQRLDLLERELEDLKERVRATERLIQDEKNFMASSKQEADDLPTQLKIELAELSILSRQIVSSEDKDDEAAIAEADRVWLEAIGTIDEFLQKNAL
jgi:hypothetical protein